MFGEICFVIADRSYDDAVKGFCGIRGVVAGDREDVVSGSGPFSRGRKRIGRSILRKQEELCFFERATEGSLTNRCDKTESSLFCGHGWR
jgi:hypothetical protein